jgi:hypothetical protein
MESTVPEAPETFKRLKRPPTPARIPCIPTHSTSANPKPGPPDSCRFPLPLLIALAGAAAYAGSFSIPLIFDDLDSIANNPSIRHWSSAFWPPNEATVGGRPILNLSLALNYAIGGTSVWGYHALNLIIHILAGLALYGIVRRTLAPRSGSAASLTAFLVALLWILHPLQTESVTYIIQRAESLMGLFYLLTLYCFIRYAEGGPFVTRPGPTPKGRKAQRRTWAAFSVLACVLGMGTKEVMVSAPLVVLLYDRAFLSGSFREAWRRSRVAYSCLAGTWLVLATLVLSTKGRGGTVGLGRGMGWSDYVLTQFPAIVHYLRLCFWPHPLIFSYGNAVASGTGRILLCASVVAVLVAASAWALVRKPVIGFLGAGFFVILAPSSSFVPIATETMAEQRMYLPLIFVVALAVVGLHRWLGRGCLVCCLVIATALFGATWRRNQEYSNPLELWRETVASCPGNFFAHYNYGSELAKIPGRLKDSIAQFEEALRLNPESIEARFFLACDLQNTPALLPEAVAQYGEVLRRSPDYYQAHVNLGNVLAAQGRAREAIAQYEAGLRLKPDVAEIHFNLATVLLETPEGAPEAVEHLKAGLRLQPANEQARQMLARVTAPQPN